MKYTSKGEKASSVLNDAFTNAVQNISDKNDIHSTFKKIIVKSVGQRDYSVQEVMHHLLSLKCISVRLLIKGIAGSGKSYVIDGIRNELQVKCQVLAYTGKASFNVNGVTLHSFFQFPISTKRLTDLKRIALQQLQSDLENVDYLIMDEYSFVGQSSLGWIDSRCRQATGKAGEGFGGLSVILVGDIAQLPPVGDRPLYHSMPKTDKQIQGYFVYRQFKQVIELKVNHGVNGYSSD